MLAGGGESCADIEHLRAEAALFGFVASDSTLHRSLHEINAKTRAAIATELASVRAQVWKRSATTKAGPVFLDIDASLVEIHSENKEQAAPTYKGGFGFHPMFCFADATGEALSGVLRPGNAGSNTAADHVRVLDEAISQLPDDVQAGHHVGENASLVRREVVCRTDSGGTTAAFTTALRARNIKFFTSAMTNDQVQAAIFDAEGIEEVWVPALGKDGEERDGSSVCELTSLVVLSALPSGTRLIVRREPLHPGAQRSLFPSLEYRYWGFYTDCEGEPAELDLMMRAHAHVENHIARLKDSGLCRFPFSSFAANANWMAVVMLSADLVRWFQLLCCDGYWSCARPKALDGACSTHRAASFALPGAASCASSSTGHRQAFCFAPTATSKPSPDRFEIASTGRAWTCHAHDSAYPCGLGQMRASRPLRSPESSSNPSDRPQSRATFDPQ